MLKRQDGIVSYKTCLDEIFWMFELNIINFIDLFKIQIILENANQIQQGIIQQQEDLRDLKVNSMIIKKHYEAIYCKMNNDEQYVNLEEGNVDFILINQLYDNITCFNQYELKSFISKVQILKSKYQIRFFKRSQEIINNCIQIINVINGSYHSYYKTMVELITNLHEKTIQKILCIHQQKYQYFKTFDNFELISSQISSFIRIYIADFDFKGFKPTQLVIMLQYFEILLDNKLQKHQYVDFKNFQNLENIRDPYKIAQVLQIYSDNLREEFEIQFIKNNKITQNIRIQVKKVLKSQLVQDIMKDIQSSLNLLIDLSWDFLPYIGLVIIPNCNFKGLTLRNRGITINLTPFLDLYKQGFTDGYKDMMYAYCILVAINGWNCLQLIKKTQKSFYWYDDHIQDLNLEEFIFYKNLFGITKIQENKQLFSLQYLNQHTAKLILSIGEQQYTKDELYHLFRDQPQIQQNQPQLQLFNETIEEQLEMGTILD